MNLAKFIQIRADVVLSVRSQVEETLPNPKHETEQFLPIVTASGSVAQQGLKVPFEPIKYDYRHYDSDWAIKSGNVNPLTPYPVDVLDTFDKVNDFIKTHPNKEVKTESN